MVEGDGNNNNDNDNPNNSDYNIHHTHEYYIFNAYKLHYEPIKSYIITTEEYYKKLEEDGEKKLQYKPQNYDNLNSKNVQMIETSMYINY